MTLELDPFTRILLTITVIIFGVFVFLCLYQWFFEFTSELRYLNAEIKRTQGKEKRYWICQRRKLWLSIIPFIKR